MPKPFDISQTTELDEASARRLFDDFDEAIAAATNQGFVIDLLSLCSRKGRLHEGHLELDELLLSAGAPTLYVDGDLTVRGLIEHQFRAGNLVVFGNLRAEHLVTTAQVLVTGDLTVRGTLFGNCTNYATTVLGSLSATALIGAKEHLFCVLGQRTVRRIVDVQGGTPYLVGPSTESESALVDEVDGFDEGLVSARLRAGLGVLR